MNLPLSNTKERIISIDIIRGFALIGIFFVNIPSMFMPDFYYHFEYVGMDLFTRLIYDMLIQTKFYTIFAFLFGVSGFYFMNGMEKKGLSPYKFFSRRLVWMFIFGVIHTLFLWAGDILHTYALLGFILLLFYKSTVKKMLIWAGCLFLLYFSLESLVHFTSDNATGESSSNLFTAFKNENGEVNYYYQFFEQMKERWDFILTSIPYELTVYPFEFIPIFLVGMASSKAGIFTNTSTYLKGIKIVQFLVLVASVPFFVLMIQEYVHHQPTSSYYVFITGKLLATFYVCTLLRLLQKPIWEKRLSFLAPLGKMAFTNYLTHSVITLAFVSLFIKDTLSIALWMQPFYAMIIIVLQIQFSKYILSKWKFGPLEFVWRLLTYGKSKSTSTTFTREM